MAKHSEWHGTFADRLRNRVPVGVFPWWGTGDVARPGYLDAIADEVQQTFDTLRHAEVFVADNVAEYLYAGTAQENWTIDDFPCVAPPFETMFIEYGRPSTVVSEVYGETDPKDTTARRTGWLFTASARPDREAGWVLSGTVILEFDPGSMEAEMIGSTVLWSGVALHYLLRADGSIEAVSPPGALYPTHLNEEERNDVARIAGALSGSVWAALLALTFVNCKNVPRREVGPPEKLQRRDRKLGKEPRRSYHVLDIGPMRRILHTEGRSGEHGAARALHVCRGHFKTYSPDAPLFGRVIGTWWWAPQVRGSKDAGEVTKDYRVRG